jgi:acetoin utilization protein AcuB
MHAGQLMKLEVVTVPAELPVEAAHRLMLARGLRHLPVVAGHKLAGMVSDRDLLLVMGRGKKGELTYPQLTVGEVMSPAPVSAGPHASIGELAKVMVESKIDAIPIISAQNVLVGLVTSTDLMLLLTELPTESQPALSFQIRRAADLAAQA